MSTQSEEWLSQQIVEKTQDAIIFADREGIIRIWNSGAEITFGYSASEAIGQSLDLIIPERQRVRHWEGYRKVMATGVTRYGRELLKVPGMRRDNTRISLEFTIALVCDEAGQPIGAGAILRDVTARWEQDKALRERLAVLEGHQKRTN